MYVRVYASLSSKSPPAAAAGMITSCMYVCMYVRVYASLSSESPPVAAAGTIPPVCMHVCMSVCTYVCMSMCMLLSAAQGTSVTCMCASTCIHTHMTYPGLSRLHYSRLRRGSLLHVHTRTHTHI